MDRLAEIIQKCEEKVTSKAKVTKDYQATLEHKLKGEDDKLTDEIAELPTKLK
jgi:hypothetical protein